MNARKAAWAGMNWIRQEKRLAIYLRDGLACAYCGQGVEQAAQLTLDHVKPCNGQHKGDHRETNLVTCCTRCNCSRGNRSVKAFCKVTAAYLNHGISPAAIEQHVKACTRRSLPKAEAKQLIERRGSAAKALASMGN